MSADYVMSADRDVVLCECFARDGLQHETTMLTAAQKVALISRFAEGGANLFRGEADEQRGLANAGPGELFEQVREVRLPGNRCVYLGPIRDDRPKRGSEPTGVDRRRKAREL